MNTVNASTSFSGFQLHLGCSPRVIPPLITTELGVDLKDAAQSITLLLTSLSDDVTEARDNLLQVKISQAHHANASHAPDPEYEVGSMVMLSTANH